ncbi:hypothetical protein F5Y13DRAFT_184689 [Hypoxylon sp. FL1857]|nr:hypothetical protein F5Y13DRAFT_184689 [Hypoxylon sp. FL1857]
MPVLTRKRKAQLEAEEAEKTEGAEKAEEDAHIAAPLKSQHAAQEPPLKSPKLTELFERTDPFRPLAVAPTGSMSYNCPFSNGGKSPRNSPPPRTVWRHKSQIRYPKVKRVAVNSRRPLPVIFFTIPETTKTKQVAKSRSSNNVDTILATKSLFEHIDLHGTEAIPSHQALVSWLEENKNEFIRATKERAHKQPTSNNSTPSVGTAAVGAIATYPEMPAIQNPEARPRVVQPRRPMANSGIFRRVVRYTRRATASLLSRLAAAIEDPVSDEPEQSQQQSQEGTAQHQPQSQEERGGQGQDHQQSTVGEAVANLEDDHGRMPRSGPEVVAGKEMIRVRPVAPPLDARFFHPNGQLQSVYKYLTAQIPLPWSWVRWAIRNDIVKVPGRGDIREPGVYVAEDTFDYDALYQAIHSGSFRTGRIEIDYYPEHWPFVEGQGDSMIADLELHPFTTTFEGGPCEGRAKKSAAPSPEPPHIGPAA